MRDSSTSPFVTVIHDFSDLESVGRQHFMNLHGGCASTEELENLDGYETALLLIDGGGGVITPYGVLYDNGMQMEQLYKGGPFPPYLYDVYELVLTISPDQNMENATELYLPSAAGQIERALRRGGITEQQARFAKLESIQLPGKITGKLNLQYDSLWEVNEMCQAIHRLGPVDRAKLDAAVEYARADTARQIQRVADHLDQFDFVPNVHTPEEYGRYLIQNSGKFGYDENLERFYNYDQFGRDSIEAEDGRFIDGGYIVYHGDLHLDELLMDDPTQQGPQMGGM